MGKKEFLDEGQKQQLAAFLEAAGAEFKKTNISPEQIEKFKSIASSAFNVGYSAAIYSYEQLLEKLNVKLSD